MKKYYYPDGTPTGQKFRDGEKFHLIDTVDGSISEWTWDDFYEQWYRDGNKKSKSSTNDDLLKEFERLINEMGSSTNVCQCGSEKVGSINHSTWCPKYS